MIDTVTLVSLLMIILIGLPHGALDGAVSICLDIKNDFFSKFYFFLIYIGLAIFVTILWINFPQVCLILFLLISIFHFGLGDFNWSDKKEKYILGFINGGLVIFGISITSPTQVDIIFKSLSFETNFVWLFINIGSLILVSFLPWLFINLEKLSTIDIIRLFLIILSVLFLHPLLAFAIYFCFIHTINHFMRIIPSLKKRISRSKIIKLFSLFTFTSWTIGIIIFNLFRDSYGDLELIYRIIFIGLAALTVPHMILIDFYFRPKEKI